MVFRSRLSASVENQKSKIIVEPSGERELDVLKLIAQGLSNCEIGERLFLGLSTTQGHNLKSLANPSPKPHRGGRACPGIGIVVVKIPGLPANSCKIEAREFFPLSVPHNNTSNQYFSIDAIIPFRQIAN